MIKVLHRGYYQINQGEISEWLCMCETVDLRSMQHQTECKPQPIRYTAYKNWTRTSCVEYFHIPILLGGRGSYQLIWRLSMGVSRYRHRGKCKIPFHSKMTDTSGVLVHFQDPKNVTGTIGLSLDIRARSLGIHDNFAPMFRNSAIGSWATCMWAVVRCDCEMRFVRVGWRWSRGRGMKSCLRLKMRLWLEGPDIDDGAEAGKN